VTEGKTKMYTHVPPQVVKTGWKNGRASDGVAFHGAPQLNSLQRAMDGRQIDLAVAQQSKQTIMRWKSIGIEVVWLGRSKSNEVKVDVSLYVPHPTQAPFIRCTFLF
jgi:hypothetical protein